MGTVYVDSTVGDDLRRERLFAGELFVFSPGANSAALCSHAQDMAQEAFAPHDPSVAQDSMTAGGLRHDPRRPQAAVHPSPAGQGADPGHAVRPRVRPRADVLRRAPAPDDGAWRVHEGRSRAPVPPTPGHVVLGAVRATQLVAPRLRDRIRQFDGLPPAVLRRANREQLVDIRLRRLDPDRTAASCAAGQGRDAEAARAPRGASSSTRRSASLRRSAGSYCSPPLNCTRRSPTPPSGRGSASTSAPSTSTTCSMTGRQPTSTRPAQARRSATSSARATSSLCRRMSSSATASWRQAQPDRPAASRYHAIVRRSPSPRDVSARQPSARAATSGSTSTCCSSGLTGTWPNAGAPATGPMSSTMVSTTSRTAVRCPTPMSIVVPSTSGATAAARYASATSGAKTKSMQPVSAAQRRALAGKELRDHVRNKLRRLLPGPIRERGSQDHDRRPEERVEHARVGRCRPPGRAIGRGRDRHAPTRPVPRAATRSIRRGDSRCAWLLRGSRRSPAGWRRASGAPRRSNARLAPRPRDG